MIVLLLNGTVSFTNKHYPHLKNTRLNCSRKSKSRIQISTFLLHISFKMVRSQSDPFDFHPFRSKLFTKLYIRGNIWTGHI